MQLTPKHYAQAWFELSHSADKKDQSAINHKMIKLIYKNGHASWLYKIVSAIEIIETKTTGQENVKIISACGLEDKLADKIAVDVLKNKKLHIQQSKNNSLIGGLIIETQNTRWDLSVRGRINQLTKHLLNTSVKI
jgi:F0F1-type ATP synthase delta subunit